MRLRFVLLSPFVGALAATASATPTADLSISDLTADEMLAASNVAIHTTDRSMTLDLGAFTAPLADVQEHIQRAYVTQPGRVTPGVALEADADSIFPVDANPSSSLWEPHAAQGLEPAVTHPVSDRTPTDWATDWATNGTGVLTLADGSRRS